jgi:outer membrane biosynthesis protein TonB
MNGFSAVDRLGNRQERIIRRMMVLSLVAHLAALVLGSALSPLFPSMRFSPPVIVELADAPMSELTEESPAPAPPMSPALQTESPTASPRAPVSSRPVAKEPPAARRWLDQLDAGIPKVPDAPVARKEGKAGGIPVRHWTNEGPARPGDFAPAVAPERTAALGKHLEELEGRVRQSGRPGVGFGKETEASMMFGGTGDAAGEPIPAWIRDMIRKRVRDYLPELEGVYTDAIRRNPDLRGKLIVRFRIDPSGKIRQVEPAEEQFQDAAFVKAVLDRIRRWTFEPTGERAVEVLYPFVFVAPS